jgi:hypothetical protein
VVGTWGAGYGVAGTWGAGYGMAGVPVAGDMLPTTRSPFTIEILVNTPICCMFSQINGHVLYILVNFP